MKERFIKNIPLAMKLILCLLLFFTLFILTSIQATAQNGICSASNISSLKDCFTQIANNTANNIEVTNIIYCNGDKACEFSLSGITNRPINIYGRQGSNAGFIKTDNFNYSFILIQNSDNITLRNLSFEDKGDVVCNFDYSVNRCSNTSSSVVVNWSNNITLDHLRIVNAKFHGVESNTYGNITLKNSTIDNVEVFGLAVGGGQNMSVVIENNIFMNNKSNAIAMAVSSTNQSYIRNNVFINNHRTAVFNICGGLCSGGQMYIISTKNLTIENNIIKDGNMNPDVGWGTSGIEFDDYTDNITVKNNDIYNNSGVGVIVNSGLQHIGKVSIENNKFFSNRNGDINFPNAQLTNNCFTVDCVSKITQPIGPIITADLNHDGKVDVYDYNILVSNFGATGVIGWHVSDLNPDGKIDIFDYNILVSNFGSTQ